MESDASPQEREVRKLGGYIASSLWCGVTRSHTNAQTLARLISTTTRNN